MNKKTHTYQSFWTDNMNQHLVGQNSNNMDVNIGFRVRTFTRNSNEEIQSYSDKKTPKLLSNAHSDQKIENSRDLNIDELFMKQDHSKAYSNDYSNDYYKASKLKMNCENNSLPHRVRSFTSMDTLSSEINFSKKLVPSSKSSIAKVSSFSSHLDSIGMRHSCSVNNVSKAINDTQLKNKKYSCCDLLTEKLLSTLRLPQEILQEIRSKHLKKMQAPQSKYYFEYKYAKLLNKRNGFYEKKKKKHRKSFANNGPLSKLFPSNVQEEKEQFIRNFKLGYELKCPKFKFQKKFFSKKGLNDNIFELKQYKSQNPEMNFGDTLEEVHPYHYVSTKYLSIAIGIMDRMKKKYGNLHNYYESQGDKVSSEDSLNYFAFYLRDQGLAKLGITIQVCEDTASPTFCKGKKLIVRLPIKNYRMQRLQGVAHHEIGTHLIRYINNTRQVWYKKKVQFSLRPHMITEEGLATLNTYIHAPDKLMCHAAIHYYAAVMASRMNFSQLFQSLFPWIGDEERTWTECLRVKRGISGNRKGAFTKDQIYLIGAIKILKKRKKIDFRELYSGKIAIEDLNRLKEMSLIDKDSLYLPKFISEDFQGYMNSLSEIAKVNGLSK